MDSILHRGIPLEVYGRYDVAVIGGGTAGAAAAIRAAQLGCSTLVVEKATALGGTAVNALVMPMMNSNVEHMELLAQIDERLQAMGVQTHHRYNKGIWFGGEDMSYCLEQMLLENGGEILYDACLTDVCLEDGCIRYAVVFAEGRAMAIVADHFVDASGDAVLARLSGVPCASGDEEGNNQCVTMRFEMGGIDVEKYRAYCTSIHDTFCPMQPGEFFESAMVGGKGFALEPLFQKGVEEGVLQPMDLRYYQCFTVPGKPGCMSFNCPHIVGVTKNTSARARSQAFQQGRQMIRRLVRFLQKYMPGFEQAFLLREASMLGIRESYRIQGQYLLDEQDYMNRARFADGVVKGDWYMDVHAAAGKAADWKEYTPGEYYEIPYRSLVTNQAENLIVAGRCISTSFLMQASIRIQPTLTDMGQIAGEACALAKQTGTPLAKLDGARLRRRPGLPHAGGPVPGRGAV